MEHRSDAQIISGMSGTVITVWDGARTVAKAKKLMPGAGGWLLTMYDGCWINPKARTPNVQGRVDAQYMMLRDRRQVMKEFNALLRQVRCEIPVSEEVGVKIFSFKRN